MIQMNRFLLAILTVGSLAAQVPADRRQFVACPVVRDTKTQPCWLAEYNGETYYLGLQGGVINDFYPPQQAHEVLVEGTVVSGPRVCGGIPLKPVRISPMIELNQACTTMLPAEDGIEAPAPVPPPGIGQGPSWVKLDGPNSLTIYFEFDRDFLSAHSTAALNNLANAAKQSMPTHIEVTGYHAATLLSDAKTITEKPSIGEGRAKKVAEILIGLGIPKEIVSVTTPVETVRPDGVNDPWNRKVIVVVKK